MIASTSAGTSGANSPPASALHLVPEQLLRHRAFAIRGLPGEQEEEGQPQCVDVGANIHAMAVDPLLRGEVVGRAEHRGAIELLGDVVVGVLEEEGQAHVQDLDVPLLVEQEVGGLDVAVDQPGLVCVLQAQCRLTNAVGGPLDVHRAFPRDRRLQARAFDVLDHQEVHLAVLIDIVSPADVRMVERGARPRLAMEPLDCGRVSADGVGQHLDGHAPAHDLVLAQEHRAHAALAQLIQEFVLPVDDQLYLLFQHLGLKTGQQPQLHQPIGNPGRIFGQIGIFLEKGVQRLVFQHAAVAEHVQEFTTLCRGGHEHTLDDRIGRRTGASRMQRRALTDSRVRNRRLSIEVNWREREVKRAIRNPADSAGKNT